MTYCEHPRPRPKATAICKRCGKQYERDLADIKRGCYKHCSLSCAKNTLSVEEETALNELLDERVKLEAEVKKLEQKKLRLKELTYHKLAQKFDLTPSRVFNRAAERLTKLERIE